MTCVRVRNRAGLISMTWSAASPGARVVWPARRWVAASGPAVGALQDAFARNRGSTDCLSSSYDLAFTVGGNMHVTHIDGDAVTAALICYQPTGW